MSAVIWQRFAWAAAASAGLHAAVLALTGPHVAEPVDLPPLVARLTPASPDHAAPAVRPSSPRAARSAPLPISAPAATAAATPSVDETPADPLVETAEATADAPPAAPPPAQTVAETATTAPPPDASAAESGSPRDFPRSGRITYELVYGRDQFPVGRTVQSWAFEGERYQLASRSVTTGLADLVRPQHRTYLSQGALTPEGLRPERFTMSRNRGRGLEEARAVFDWSDGQVSLGASGAPTVQRLPPGTQDIVSIIYQLALDPPASGRVHFAVTNGRRIDTYAFDVRPEETIETPLGTLRTLPVHQVRRPGAESVDVWLASEYRYLPVRIRFIGRDGEPAGEQLATEIRLAEK